MPQQIQRQAPLVEVITPSYPNQQQYAMHSSQPGYLQGIPTFCFF